MTTTAPGGKPNIRFTPMNIRRKARKLAEARDRVVSAELELHAVIRVALSQGTSAADAAEAAGLSRERIYQIRDGRR